MIWCDYITHCQSGIQTTQSHPSSANKYDDIVYLVLWFSIFFLGGEIQRLIAPIKLGQNHSKVKDAIVFELLVYHYSQSLNSCTHVPGLL